MIGGPHTSKGAHGCEDRPHYKNDAGDLRGPTLARVALATACCPRKINRGLYRQIRADLRMVRGAPQLQARAPVPELMNRDLPQAALDWDNLSTPVPTSPAPHAGHYRPGTLTDLHRLDAVLISLGSGGKVSRHSRKMRSLAKAARTPVRKTQQAMTQAL